MKKLALSLSLALALSSVSTVFAAIPQKVRIGTDPTYAPFESKNAQGELVGFDIDLAKELCKRINTQCTFIENPLDALIPSLKAKKIDAIMSSLSITEKRQQEIAFTDKLYAADSRLVVKKGSDITPDLAKLKGKRVGVLQGTTQETYGNEHWAPKGIEIVSYQGQDNIYSDLTAGRIDARSRMKSPPAKASSNSLSARIISSAVRRLKTRSCSASAPVWGCAKRITNCVKH
jgi:histidine transport system substrate-binding protein